MIGEELRNVNEKYIERMKKEQGVLGAWYFGSLSHGNLDEYSDIDIIFLLDESGYERINAKRNTIMSETGVEIVMEWAEDFNGIAVKNYCYILKAAGKLFQYDVFLLNQKMLDDYMCQIHYADLVKENIIFEYESSVSDLLHKKLQKQTWSADIHRVIQTYWFHIHMTAKYFVRKDFFKLEGVLRTLMDMHTSLLLMEYDQITWGGAANKLHFIPEEKQKHLMKYGCIGDLEQMQKNLLQSMEWFIMDSEELADREEVEYCLTLGNTIREYWINQFR